MKTSTSPKIVLSLALLATGAQAASLSLGIGGLAQTHSTVDPAESLHYIDPSGIVITFNGQPQIDYASIGHSRGWNNDPNPGVHGFLDVLSDHLAIAHFVSPTGSATADTITLDFSNALGIDLSSVRLLVYDLDLPTLGSLEILTISDNPSVIGIGDNQNGTLTHEVGLTIPESGIVTLTPNQTASIGYSAFDLTWERASVPEPTTSLLALAGGSLLIFRRRR